MLRVVTKKGIRGSSRAGKVPLESSKRKSGTKARSFGEVVRTNNKVLGNAIWVNATKKRSREG